MDRDVKDHIRNLRHFYTNILMYGGVILLCLCIWLTTGGAFWPLWVIVAFSVSTVVQAVKLGMCPIISDMFPFLKPDWEEEKVKEYQKSVEKKSIETKASDPDSQS